MTSKIRMISKPMYFVAGALMGFMFYYECIKDMNTEYMKNKFEYLQKNDIENYTNECRQLNLDCNVFSYKKEDGLHIEIYLENNKLTKVIGVE